MLRLTLRTPTGVRAVNMLHRRLSPARKQRFY
jgi:hypothetical protein